MLEFSIKDEIKRRENNQDSNVLWCEEVYAKFIKKRNSVETDRILMQEGDQKEMNEVSITRKQGKII